MDDQDDPSPDDHDEDADGPIPDDLTQIRDELDRQLRIIAAIKYQAAAEQAPYRREIDRLVNDLARLATRTGRNVDYRLQRAQALAAAHYRLEQQLGHRQPEKTLNLPYGTASIRTQTVWDWPADPDTVADLAAALIDVDEWLVRHVPTIDKAAVKKCPALVADPDTGALIVKATGEKLPVHITREDRVTITPVGPT